MMSSNQNSNAVVSSLALTEQARYFDYRMASNPLSGEGAIAPVTSPWFGSELHESGPTGIVTLDNAKSLGCEGAATTPGLCASFVHINPGDHQATDAEATSQLFFVIRGDGNTQVGASKIKWSEGDIFTLPARSPAVHQATSDVALYWVHDGPLLQYLGAEATRQRFSPTLYRRDVIRNRLDEISRDPSSAKANRLSVLLGHENFPQTKTITHVIWAMYGRLPVGAVQAPHRHQAVALDLVVECEPGCYTMVGSSLDKDGWIKDGARFDWKPGAAFVTPPGLWHSHHNESGSIAHILPIQDAGLHTYLRTLNILFTRRKKDGSFEIVTDAS